MNLARLLRIAESSSMFLILLFICATVVAMSFAMDAVMKVLMGARF